MAKDDFEIVPKKEVDGIKKDVEDIKRDPLGYSASGKELMGSINELTKSMKGMSDLFDIAGKEIKEEMSIMEFIKHIKPMFEKINERLFQITDEHKEIAEQITILKESIDELKKGKVELKKTELHKPEITKPAPDIPPPSGLPRMPPNPM